jgi:ectoine hydroxylase-related dioxygenase (phytanoyl-CoA dioxygenase family)
VDVQGLGSEGYRLIGDFIAASELARLSAFVAQALAAPLAPGCSRPGNELRPLRWNDDVVAFMLGSASRVSRLRSALGATDLKWISAYLSIKQPHSPSLAWHQDWWCWDHPVSLASAPPQVALLCYVTETNAGNGALRLLPGSHRRGSALHRAVPEAHADLPGPLPADHVAMSEAAGQISPRLRAGDAVVLDYRLLHGTYPNNTEQRRDCIILSFAPDWSALPHDIRAHLVQHPALPREDEADASAASAYGDLLPSFSGARRSLRINRVPPAGFSLNPA